MKFNELKFNIRYNTILMFFMIIIFVIFGLITFFNDLYDDKCGDGNDDCTYAPKCSPDDIDCNNIGEENDIKYDEEI